MSSVKTQLVLSCVLTDLPTLICLKHNGDDKSEKFLNIFIGWGKYL